MEADHPDIAVAVTAALTTAAEPLTVTVLHKRLRRRLPALTEPELLACLEALTAAGGIYPWPLLPGARARRYGSEPPDPRDYLKAPVRAALEAVERESQRLAALGVPRERVLAAARELLAESPLFSPPREVPAEEAAREPSAAETLQGTTLEAAILDQIRRLGEVQRHGGLVSMRELRQAMAPHLADPRSFDAVLLALGRRGAAWLYRHDYPAGLTEAERSAMVGDGQGNYYNGVSLKE